MVEKFILLDCCRKNGGKLLVAFLDIYNMFFKSFFEFMIIVIIFSVEILSCDFLMSSTDDLWYYSNLLFDKNLVHTDCS